MKVGELMDIIKRYRDTEAEIQAARVSLSHGGNEETMRHKQERLTDAVDELNRIEDEELPL